MKKYIKFNSDRDYGYQIIGYKGRDIVDQNPFYGFDPSVILNYARSMIEWSNVDHIRLQNLATGAEFFNTANAWYTYVEDGDLPEEAYSIIDE